MDGEALVSYCLNGDAPDNEVTFDAAILSPHIISPPGESVVMLLPTFLSGAELNYLTAHYELLKELGAFHVDKRQCHGRLLLFNDGMAASLHAKAERALSRVLCRPMKRSYSLAAIYPIGCELNRHIDRRECGWTISILLDVEGGCEAEEMCFGFAELDVIVPRKPGFAILFDGTSTPHWRTATSTSAASYTTLLLHFVPH